MTVTKYKEELQEELRKKFHSPEKFAQGVEQIMKTNSEHNYITAIVEYCEKNQIDIELVPKLMTKPLKEKLKWAAMELNFLKKTSLGKLPL
jgi:hypothetical protein